MKRSGRLVRATDHETAHPTYQDGLQAMWEARWTRLGADGRAHWLQRHGELPAAACPLVEGAVAPA
ncbi:MAG: hypothetical protein IPL96_17535 [Holophagaceae bacterium]|nr:hypothetical protein [Holophagaceae bacterium]